MMEKNYILPQDSDPDLLSRTALSRTELFQEILKLNLNLSLCLWTLVIAVFQEMKNYY